MKIIFLLRNSALALCFGVLLQFALVAADTPETAASSANSENKKLTPVQQKGLDLLREAEASAGQLSPEMRVVILAKISEGYEKFSPYHRIELLRDAFQASTLMPDPSCPGDIPCGDKISFQSDILQKLAWLAPDETEKLLSQIHPYVRRMVMERLADNCISRGNFDHAVQLLNLYEDDPNFPYPTVMSLMRALPAERTADRVALFNAAVANFRALDHKRNYGTPDLGDLVLQFWRQLPPDLALQAANLLLDQGKQVAGSPDNIQRDMSSRKGHLSLDSYQYRLFQLLPILRELDPARAAELLREQKQTAALMEKYPEGFASFSPLFVGGSGTSYETTSVSSGRGGGPLTDAQLQFKKWSEAVDSQQHAVQALEGSNADRAFELAKTIPVWSIGDNPQESSPRAQAMLGIAEMCGKTNPAIAIQAVEEAQKVLDDIAPSGAMQILSGSGNAYLAAGRRDQLEILLRRGGKLAEKIYAGDTDTSDPNQAAKRQWPSTDCWRRLITLAANVSPDLAEKLISRIPDPEIQAIEKVVYGNALLGVSDMSFNVSESHKRGSRSYAGN